MLAAKVPLTQHFDHVTARELTARCARSHNGESLYKITSTSMWNSRSCRLAWNKQNITLVWSKLAHTKRRSNPPHWCAWNLHKDKTSTAAVHIMAFPAYTVHNERGFMFFTWMWMRPLTYTTTITIVAGFIHRWWIGFQAFNGPYLLQVCMQDHG